MARKQYPPADDTQELTRQVEMLTQGLSVTDGSRTPGVGQPAQVKRRTLDDMRRLSEHIKSVPIYTRK